MDLLKTIESYLKREDNSLLRATYDWCKAWKDYRYNTKQKLEHFLCNNIVEISYRNANQNSLETLFCTSHVPFIKGFLCAKNNVRDKILTSPFSGIRSKGNSNILTYDLVKCTYHQLKIINIQIVNFITIVPENIQLLNDISRCIVFKAKLHDVKQNLDTSKDTSKKITHTVNHQTKKDNGKK